MDKAWWDRWSPLNGIAFVVLLIIGFIVIGEFPAVGDPAEEYAAFYDDRGQVLAAAILFAAALFLFIWFAAALAGRVGDAGESRLAAAILAGGVGFAAMGLAATGMLATIAHTAAAEVDPAVLKGLDMLGTGVDIMSAVPLAVLVFAFGVAVMRAGVLASWFGYVSVVVAILVLLLGTTWAQTGFWSPYGGYSWIAYIALFAWIVVAAALLVARPVAPSATAGSTRSISP